MTNPPTNPVPRSAGGPLSAPSAWNVANALTILRLLLVPLFVWLLFRNGGADEGSRLLGSDVYAVAQRERQSWSRLVAWLGGCDRKRKERDQEPQYLHERILG